MGIITQVFCQYFSLWYHLKILFESFSKLAKHQTGDKPSHDPMMIQITVTYILHRPFCESNVWRSMNKWFVAGPAPSWNNASLYASERLLGCKRTCRRNVRGNDYGAVVQAITIENDVRFNLVMKIGTFKWWQTKHSGRKATNLCICCAGDILKFSLKFTICVIKWKVHLKHIPGKVFTSLRPGDAYMRQ